MVTLREPVLTRTPMLYGGGGLLLLILDIYVIYLILTKGSNPDRKVLWIIIVLLLPLIGPILYLLMGQ